MKALQFPLICGQGLHCTKGHFTLGPWGERPSISANQNPKNALDGLLGLHTMRHGLWAETPKTAPNLPESAQNLNMATASQQ